MPTSEFGGKPFVGWWTKREGGEKVDGSAAVAENTTYYAHWVEYEIDNGVLKGVTLNGAEELSIPKEVHSVVGRVITDGETLTRIAIPASVTNINTKAFVDCANLKTIEIAADNRYYKMAGGVVLTKDGLSVVAVPQGQTSVTIVDGVTNIMYGAFSGCGKLENLTIDSNDIMSTLDAIPGLMQAKFDTRFDTTSTLNDASNLDIVSGAIAAYTYTSSAPWEFDDPLTGAAYYWNERDSTFVYAGQMYMEAGKVYVFGAHFDDDVYMKVDNQVLINVFNSANNMIYTGSYACTSAGWHYIEFRLSDYHSGKGSWGNYWSRNFGLGYRDDGVPSTTQSQWKPLLDPGDGSLLRCSSAVFADCTNLKSVKI